VALFFVLSGTVLAISLKRFSARPMEYLAYFCRRAFRLIPLVVATSIVGFAYVRLSGNQNALPGMSDFFVSNYHEPISLVQFAASFVGLSVRPNPPLWSIYVEMIGSILLPFMVIAASDRLRLLAILGGLLAVSFCVFFFFPVRFRYDWPVFIFNFALGISINWWEGPFNRAVTKAFDPHPNVFALAGLVMLISVRSLIGYRGHGDPVDNFIEAIVAACLIARMMHSPPQLFLHPLAVRLGDVSYGIYLIHFPLLYVLIAAASAIAPPWYEHVLGLQVVIICLTLAISIALAGISFRFIEQPGINIGKALAKRVSRVPGTDNTAFR